MTEENGQHEFNFFLDKQIQQRLLEADEELLAKESSLSQVPSIPALRLKAISVIGSTGTTVSSIQVNKNNNSNLQKALNKELQTIPLCGWCAEASVTYRKTENDGLSKSKGNTSSNNRESLLSRDSRNRSQVSQEFVFRHYTDPRHYIEQYRREHSCYDTANSSATKNEFLDTRRFYAYNQYSPLAVSTQNSSFQQSTTLPPAQQESAFVQGNEQQYQSLPKQPQTPTIQYTNRREQQRHTIHATLRSNSQHKYKLSNTLPSKSDSNQVFEKVSEFSEPSERTKRAGSAKESPSTPTINGVSVQKALATKVNVPSSNCGVTSARNLKPPRPGSPLDSNISNQFLGQKLGHSSGGPSRTLDTLACVAGSTGEKQSSGLQEASDSSSQSRLESLRLVNKRVPKPQPPQLHLTFIREEESLRQSSPPPAPFRLDCKEVSQMLRPRQGPQCAIFHSNNNNNASDLSNSTNTSSSNDGNEKTSQTPEDIAKKPKKASKENSSWVERSLLAMNEQSSAQTRNSVCDRWTVAKKHEERTLISHKRRIKHLIEQSRLKSKFGHFLRQTGAQSRKTALKISNIQIGDPFCFAEPGTDVNQNNSNSGCRDQEIDQTLCTCSHTRKHGGETQGKIDDVDINSMFSINGAICQLHINPKKMDTEAHQSIRNGATTEERLFDSECHLQKNFTPTNDRDKQITSKDELLTQDFLGNFRNKLALSAHGPVIHEKSGGGNSWKTVRGSDSCLSREDNLLLTSLNKDYINKLAEQVSATVTFRVPKFKYCSVADMNRSQTMNL